MENLGKDPGCSSSTYSDSSLPSSSAQEEYPVPDVISRRLRDRELLRKRKAEAQEKESMQWFMSREQEKNKRQKRSRGARRGRGSRLVMKPIPEPEPESDSYPDPQEEAGPAPSKPASIEPVLLEELPLPTIQGPIGGIQLGAVEGKLSVRSQDPAGEEAVLKPADAEIAEALNTLLENDNKDNEYSTRITF